MPKKSERGHMINKTKHSLENSLDFSCLPSEELPDENLEQIAKMEFLNDFISFVLTQPNPTLTLTAIAIAFKFPVIYLFGAKSNGDIAKHIGVSNQALAKELKKIKIYYHL